MRHLSVLIRWFAMTVVAVLAAFALSAPLALARNPAGNAGTVKIHDGATDSEPIVANEPHVSTFHLHFLFAAPTQAGEWEIRAWAPGDKGAVVLSGSYDTVPDGSDRQPADGAYALPSGHYKLFWDGRNGQNVKHKTFWVTAGAGPTATARPTGSVAPTEGVRPSGAVDAETGVPTLPPTDALPADDAQTGGGFMTVLAILAAIASIALLATAPRAVSRR